MSPCFAPIFNSNLTHLSLIGLVTNESKVHAYLYLVTHSIIDLSYDHNWLYRVTQSTYQNYLIVCENSKGIYNKLFII